MFLQLGILNILLTPSLSNKEPLTNGIPHLSQFSTYNVNRVGQLVLLKSFVVFPKCSRKDADCNIDENLDLKFLNLKNSKDSWKHTVYSRGALT